MEMGALPQGENEAAQGQGNLQPQPGEVDFPGQDAEQEYRDSLLGEAPVGVGVLASSEDPSQEKFQILRWDNFECHLSAFEVLSALV